MDKPPIQPNNTKALHKNALYQIVQAAANVELFTIPLYMCSMYSVVGARQISGSNALYRGRWWPGAEATRFPDVKKYDDKNRQPIDDSLFSATNNDIYNKMLKIFIEEMLHLQLVANMAKVLGVEDLTFTSDELMDSKGTKKKPPGYNWECYKDKRRIPHIVDLTDTENFKHIVVRLDALNTNQIKLFKAIESSEDVLKEELKNAPEGKYFPNVPFKDWTETSKLADLPLFGSIGHMYECLWEYINMEFEDGSILLDYIGEQKDFGDFPKKRDLYNYEVKGKDGKPTGEVLQQYSFKTTFDDAVGDGVNAPKYNRDTLLLEISEMINAITDQGEGKEVAEKIAPPKTNPNLDRAVSSKAQGNFNAMSRQYKSYDDQGNLMPLSDKAAARAGETNITLDHEELFEAIEKLMQNHDFKTWDMWHEEGNRWSENMLHSKDYINNANLDKLPTPKSVADAMNQLKNGDDKDNNFIKMTKVASGAIKGITTVLNDYWKSSETKFPYPSMHGSGGRIAIFWAVFGKCPNIADQRLDKRDETIINHACQGLSLDSDPTTDTSCANFALAHTCTGSNTCRAEGGCGFLHGVAGEVNTFDPPGDNSCKGHGGCAVPISASQLFPIPKQPNPTLNLYDFEPAEGKDAADKFKAVPFGTMSYNEGDAVYDKAWEAYTKVMGYRGGKLPREKPPVSDIRLVYPPST
jgi:Ferritin-like